MTATPSALDPPDPACRIRPVRLADSAILHSVCFVDWERRRVADLVARARQIALQGRGFGVVALDDDDRPFAYGQLTHWTRSAEISDLIVCAEQRGRGTGSAIIRYLVRAARESHMQSVEIGVELNNRRALALYRRLGFAPSRVLTVPDGTVTTRVQYLTIRLR
ncbi:MAG: GNAT family N-acetyltransferase [Anaerolineaceae bacterium]|nr:MAG: GNAT family N-acetyltransferase [Anaerolineaceae bacterium]